MDIMTTALNSTVSRRNLEKNQLLQEGGEDRLDTGISLVLRFNFRGQLCPKRLFFSWEVEEARSSCSSDHLW